MRTPTLIAAILFTSAAMAQVPSIRADQPWARATSPQQKVGSGYVTLTSPIDDRLISASSPVSARTVVHGMTMDNTVMRMRAHADGLVLPAGQAVALKPGGLHLMLMDLKQPLVAGQKIPVELTFEHAPPMTITLTVAPVGASVGSSVGASVGATGPGHAGH